jgi:putative ABC transport system permease protein
MTRTGFVLRQLRARPLRTLLTAAAFALSVGLLGFLVVMNGALQEEWSVHAAQRVIVTARTSFFDRLPIAYLAKIEAVPGIQTVVPFDFVLGFYRDTRPENQVPVSAAPPAGLLSVYREADVPPEQAQAWIDDPRGALVGPILAERHGWKPGDRIVLKAPVNGGVIETTVRGVLRYRPDAGVYIHRRYLEGLTGEQGLAATFWILARSRTEVPRVTAAVQKALENAPIPALAMTERQWQLQFLEMVGNVKALLGSVGLATAFTLILVTSNSLAMSARERRNETALLRVLGFGRDDVAGFLLAEAAVYGLLGALLGTGLMFAFGKLVGDALDRTQYAGIGALLVPGTRDILVASALSCALALAAGVVPALGISRRPIVDLLRDRS